MTADDATPPLVSASPVPPVVPDREASEDFYGHGGASEHRTCGTRAFCYGCSLSCYPSTEPGLPCPCCQNALDARASGSGVVPDKPALDDWERCGHRWAGEVAGVRLCMACNIWEDDPRLPRGAYASVPADKPALAPEPLPEGWTYETSVCVVAPCCGFTFAADHTDVPNGGYSCPVCVVPAVTDDETATKVIALGLRDLASANVDPTWVANEAVALLRSAGFLLVRDHTKET